MPTTPVVAIIGDKTRSKARCHAHCTARGFFDLPLVTDMRIICGRNATGEETAAKRWAGPRQSKKISRAWRLPVFLLSGRNLVLPCVTRGAIASGFPPMLHCLSRT